jgi:uncharacterized Tic20 family protein
MADDKKKYLVAWSHFPVLFGILVPIITWFMYKDKDKKAAFQAKQAFVWQIMWAVLLLIVGVGGGLIAFSLVSGGSNGSIIFWLFPLITFAAVAVMLLFMLLGAIKTFQGKEFYYPFIGEKLK